jgi:hypothetical protein
MSIQCQARFVRNSDILAAAWAGWPTGARSAPAPPAP